MRNTTTKDQALTVEAMPETNYHYFDHTNESEALRSLDAIEKLKYVSFDQETTGLYAYNINERLRLTQLGNSKRQFIYDIWRVSDRVKDRVKGVLESTEIEKIVHNATFDIEFARADLNVLRFGKVWCTMLAEQIIACGNLSYGFSLDAITYRYLGRGVDKTEQMSDWSRPQLTSYQLTYAAKDIIDLKAIRDRQEIELNAKELLEVAEREFRCAEPVAAMQLAGFYVDPEEWADNLEEAQQQVDDIGRELCAMLAPEKRSLFDVPTINLRSTPEVKKRMEAIGVKLPIVNGKPSTDKTKLANMRDKPPEVVKLIAYRSQQTHVQKYGQSWLDFRSTTTGRIHSEYRQNGAKTGRFSDTKPPKQQIPKDGKLRNCFKAQGSGRVLTWADWSQFELRGLAQIVYNYTGDRKMIEAFENGLDYHTWTAAGIFDMKYEEVMSEQRNPAKNMNFLIVYGGGKMKLAENVQISVERAGWIIDRLFETNPALKETLDQLAREAIKNKFSKTLGGRKLDHFFNQYDNKEKARIERIGKNMPIQGLNADALKVAMRLHHDKITDTPIDLVHIVHDEMVDEHPIDWSEQAALWLEQDMMEAAKMFLPDCPVVVEVKTGLCWSK